MAKIQLLAGSTSNTINLFVQDSSSTVGAGLSGLAYNTSGLTAYYALPKATPVAITLATQTVTGAFSSGGFVELDATHCKGLYRLDIPDAAVASGRFANIYLYGATNMAPVVLEIELTATNNQDAVHGGMSALPNTACTTNASLITSGGGTDQLTVSGGIASSDAKKINAVSTSPVTTIKAVQGLATDGVVPTVTNLTNAPTAGDLTAAMKTSVTTAATAATPTVAGVSGVTFPATVASSANVSAVTAAISALLPASLTANGNLKVALQEILTTAITEGATGRIAAAWQKAWNVASSVWTSADANQTGDAYSIVNDGTVGNSALHALLSTINTSTGTTIPGLIAALNNISQAQVKAQMVAALSSDTYAEPGQGTPSATIDLATKISYLYKALINQVEQTSTEFMLYNNAGVVVDQKATVSDDGTTAKRTNITGGP